MRRFCWPTLLLLGCLLPATVGAEAGMPQRVVSLNLCTDQLVLMLLPRERIAGVSTLATDPVYSREAAAARGLPRVRHDLEQIVRLKPDRVLAAEFTDPALLDRLRRLGYPVTVFAMPNDWDGIRRFLQAFGEATGTTPAARQALARMESRRRALQRRVPEDGPSPRVLLFRPGGTTMGAGTLEDALLRLAGLTNVARERGVRGWSPLSLETVVALRPDHILVDDDGRGRHSLAQRLMRHPALARLDVPVTPVAHPNWICGTPHTLDALETLVSLR